MFRRLRNSSRPSLRPLRWRWWRGCRLFRLRLPQGQWSRGQALHLVDGRAGRLTEVAQAGSGHEALAVLSLEASPGAPADGEPVIDAVAAAELPLPYGLTVRG